MFQRIIGAVFAALVLTGLAAPAHAEWRKAETEHFVIYGDASEAQMRRYASKLERFDGLLRRYYPIPLDHELPKLDIFLAHGLGDMRKASPDISASIGGWYSSSTRIYAVVDVDSEMGDPVIFHEYGHHFMFQMASAAYPSWFVEGFAEYYSTADTQPGRLQIGRLDEGRMLSLTQPANAWAPTEDVLRWRISNGRYRGPDYYAQAWALTHYFLSDPARTQKLRRYLAAVAGGQDSIAALPDTIGRTPIQLQDDLWRYTHNSMPLLSPQIEIPEPTVEVTTLPASFGALVWTDLRLDIATRLPADDEIDEAADDDAGNDRPANAAERAERLAKARRDQADLIRQAQSLAERFPQERQALLIAARAQRLAGAPQAGLAVLQPLVGDGSNDAAALRLAGTMALDQADSETDPAARTGLRREARRYLARALDVDPLDFRTYVALDDSRKEAADYPSANDLTTLQTAAEVAPQSFDVRLRTAQALMARNRPAEAVVMLTPMANSPHGGASLGPVRKMLAEARAAAGLAATTETGAPVPAEAPGED